MYFDLSAITPTCESLVYHTSEYDADLLYNNPVSNSSSVFLCVYFVGFKFVWLCKMPVFSLIVNIILANACLFVFFFRMVK